MTVIIFHIIFHAESEDTAGTDTSREAALRKELDEIQETAEERLDNLSDADPNDKEAQAEVSHTCLVL